MSDPWSPSWSSHTSRSWTRPKLVLFDKLLAAIIIMKEHTSYWRFAGGLIWWRTRETIFHLYASQICDPWGLILAQRWVRQYGTLWNLVLFPDCHFVLVLKELIWIQVVTFVSTKLSMIRSYHIKCLRLKTLTRASGVSIKRRLRRHNRVCRLKFGLSLEMWGLVWDWPVLVRASILDS